MMVLFSVRLKQLRTDKRLTQTQVAARVGVTRSMISSYENDIRYPSYEVLVRIAYLFGVTTDYLLCMEEKRFLDISGLTDREASAVCEMVNIFMEGHRRQLNTNVEGELL